jgi:transcriptional regulator with XRE-family HTH domain
MVGPPPTTDGMTAAEAFAKPRGGRMSAALLLGEILGRAREMVGRSPEQVGDQTGVHGRTIRRLEEGSSRRPRRTTLQVLAGFYGLDVEFLVRLSEWSADGIEGDLLRDLVLEEAREVIGEAAIAELDEGEEGDLLVAVTMRLSRRRGGNLSGGSPGGMSGSASLEEEELAGLLEHLAALDRRRRRMALDLLLELRQSQAAEQTARRRERLRGAPSDLTPPLGGQSPPDDAPFA